MSNPRRHRHRDASTGAAHGTTDATDSRGRWSWANSCLPEKLTVILALALALVGIAQLLQYYPQSFFPRFPDEGIYALDVRLPHTPLDAYDKSNVRYAPAKLGYGLPLAAAVTVFGPDGPMYLSTFFWALAIVCVGATTLRRFDLMTAAIAVSFLSFSPVFGKYVAEAGPTTEAALGFVLLWIVSAWRRPWLSGLCLGFIAFVDFKWALPAALAHVLTELTVAKNRSITESAIRIGLAGVVASAVIGLALVTHGPYARFLQEYIFPHARLMQFEPSLIAVYDLAIFGALPAVAAGLIAFIIPGTHPLTRWPHDRSKRTILDALLISGMPVLFYSLFGTLKALRFFAVVLPVAAVWIAAGIAALVRAASRRGMRAGRLGSRCLSVLIPAAAISIVHGGSAGPARHLTLPIGFDAALREMHRREMKGATISSYNWPVVVYGWPEPYKRPPFAMWKLLASDRWLMLAPAMDRPTVELRLRLDRKDYNPDSLWLNNTRVYLSVTDSLFSVPCDFYASDYFLCELVPEGVEVLRRWRSWRPRNTSYLTVREFTGEKLQFHKLPNPQED